MLLNFVPISGLLQLLAFCDCFLFFNTDFKVIQRFIYKKQQINSER